MPAVSKAQFKKFFAMYNRGEISKETLDEYTKNVSYKSLPAKSRTSAAKRALAKRTKKDTA